jgi:hypothetical protein
VPTRTQSTEEASSSQHEVSVLAMGGEVISLQAAPLYYRYIKSNIVEKSDLQENELTAQVRKTPSWPRSWANLSLS